MSEDKQQLAIIRGVGYGLRDVGGPVLWFDVRLDEYSGSLQVFHQPRADEIIKEAGVKDVHDLDGKACWVQLQNTGLVKFVKVANL